MNKTDYLKPSFSNSFTVEWNDEFWGFLSVRRGRWIMKKEAAPSEPQTYNKVWSTGCLCKTLQNSAALAAYWAKVQTTLSQHWSQVIQLHKSGSHHTNCWH